ncbi:hypothetical protein NQ317_001033 [Molorchus minor]|uniref:Uncharacterized protein n=1 Tax=Molorchus minor TaxID=1323400 RepID=A0ABQ9IQY7_9CUCU|nr:hypothetical protein NQ317_001033 [Molorchus minor]
MPVSSIPYGPGNEQVWFVCSARGQPNMEITAVLAHMYSNYQYFHDICLQVVIIAKFILLSPGYQRTRGKMPIVHRLPLKRKEGPLQKVFAFLRYVSKVGDVHIPHVTIPKTFYSEIAKYHDLTATGFQTTYRKLSSKRYIIIYTLIQASEESHGSCTRKGWLLLLFTMAPWERLKFILVTHLLYSPEKNQKTRDITNSRASEISVKKNLKTQLGFELTLPTSPRRVVTDYCLALKSPMTKKYSNYKLEKIIANINTTLNYWWNMKLRSSKENLMTVVTTTYFFLQICGETGRSYTFEQLRVNSRNLSKALRKNSKTGKKRYHSTFIAKSTRISHMRHGGTRGRD